MFSLRRPVPQFKSWQIIEKTEAVIRRSSVKRCSEKMQQIDRRTLLMLKCDFDKVALQLY